MSATNHTTTIGLSQYISTDKPTYLTDYNGDMLAIDNAIASDRDGISTAQNKANTADGKADANKTSIDTLNAQINGDPTDPSDSGLAGKVTDNSGDIDTIEALLGNGTPTTSDQTVIGAVNGLEAAIAPREDGANLANSYAEGEQFARGGSVYTALTSLTAGTAFASLTLNTDYKNSDTLVEQIGDVASEVSAVNAKLGNFELLECNAFVRTHPDSVKTNADILKELHDLFAAVVAAGTSNDYYEIVMISVPGFGGRYNAMERQYYIGGGTVATLDFGRVGGNTATPYIEAHSVRITNDSTTCYCLDAQISGTGTTITDRSATVQTDTTRNMTLYYNHYKKISE